jgi:hypothetical protein
MSNEVTATDLERIVYEKRLDSLIGEFGRGYHRKIDYLVGTGEYVVLDHHEHVWNGRDAGDALEAYYNIPRQ